MHLSVHALDDEVHAVAIFFLAMREHTPLKVGDVTEAGYRKWQPLVRQQGSVRCEHSLPVLGPFDHPKHLSKIAAHPPEGFAKVFCKFHPLQLGEPRSQMLLLCPGEPADPRLCRIT